MTNKVYDRGMSKGMSFLLLSFSFPLFFQEKLGFAKKVQKQAVEIFYSGKDLHTHYKPGNIVRVCYLSTQGYN